ncbi:hypothetical protein RSD66_10160 [Brevundimonas sp. S1H14]|uniref:hypothetical protein n=1 Tax=Brevundimonas sp. S1H14 TaxID=3078084 RepID=UPI0039E89512
MGLLAAAQSVEPHDITRYGTLTNAGLKCWDEGCHHRRRDGQRRSVAADSLSQLGLAASARRPGERPRATMAAATRSDNGDGW